ncbi:MAG TPA: DUF2845 domain-containing protein [Cellvibrio sp.]|nr:DUF2845 domain-containing protein [Cellvibrio sp.]
MKTILRYSCVTALFMLTINQAAAESLRCKNAIVIEGDSKAEVLQKCGEPVFIDSYCENSQRNSQGSNNAGGKNQRCENIDVWSYNPGTGKFLTNLYFAQGKLREMRYGKRIE